MQVDLRILRFDPERDAEAALGALHGRGGPDGPRPRPAPQGQVRAGRDADLPPVVRARRVRLGRDAHQRPQPARLQDPRRPARRQADHGRAAAGPAGHQGPRRGHGRLLREVPERPAVPDDREAGARARAPPVRRRTGHASTTRPSASCARPARRPARRSGRSPSTSGRRRSSTPTASSSTRATTRPRSGSRSWPTRTASGAAGRSSTAPTPARAGSTSPRRSSRSPSAIVGRRV